MDRKNNDDSFYNAFIRTVSVTLILLGLLALGTWGWLTLTAEGPEPTPEITATNFFHTTINEEVTVSTSTRMVDKFAEAPETTPPESGSFSNFYFTYSEDNEKYKLSSKAFLDSLTNESLAVTDYLAEGFMYGRYQDEAGESRRYLVFAVTDYEPAYGSMLQNETAVANALTRIGFPDQSGFTDEIIQNQDVRRAGEEEAGVYYSFPRQNRLVITSNRATLVEIFERLRQASYETDS